MNPGIAVLDEMPERWARWRLFRNRRGTRTLLWIVLSLYPTFGVLDWVLAPRSALSLLWGTRFIVAAVTLIMFRVVRTSVFDRHPDAISSAYMLLCAFGISLMTVFMGGLASPYYAGLSLAIVATGLLFVWPAQVVPLGKGAATLSRVAADELGLRPGIPVAQGGIDAYLGMLGMGAVDAGDLAMVPETPAHLCTRAGPGRHRRRPKRNLATHWRLLARRSSIDLLHGLEGIRIH